MAEQFRELVEKAQKKRKKNQKGSFDESLHPRVGAGSPTGGRFKKKDSGLGEPSKRQYNQYVRGLTPEAQEALARVFAERLWAKIAPWLGAEGQPPPGIAFGEKPGAEAYVFAGPDGIRQVTFSNDWKQKMIYRSRNRGYADWVGAHEFRHVFQNAKLFYEGRTLPHDEQLVEADANDFATRILNEMSRRKSLNRRRKRKHKPPIQFPPPEPYNPGPISENLGRNPTSIYWPGYEPGAVQKKKKKKKGSKWDESLHPREAKGSSTGGRFKGGVSDTAPPNRHTKIHAPEGSPFQRWMDESQVPGPGGDIQIKFATGPVRVQIGGPRTIQWYQEGVGYEDDFTGRQLFLHEVGHVFDKEALTKEDRNEFRQIMGIRGNEKWWYEWPKGKKTLGSLGEMFAMAYSYAAVGQKQPNQIWWGYGYNPTKRQQNRVRALIIRAANRKKRKKPKRKIK